MNVKPDETFFPAMLLANRRRKHMAAEKAKSSFRKGL